MRKWTVYLTGLGVVCLSRSAFGQFQIPDLSVPNISFPTAPVIPSFGFPSNFSSFPLAPLAAAAGGSGPGAGLIGGLFLVFELLPLLLQDCTPQPM